MAINVKIISYSEVWPQLDEAKVLGGAAPVKTIKFCICILISKPPHALFLTYSTGPA